MDRTGALMDASRAPHGYTLVELLIVLAVLGILASMAMPLAELTVQREKERELKRALWEIRDAIDAYRRARETGAIAAPSGMSNFPPDLATLTLAWPDGRTERRGEVLRFLRRVPRDPFAPPDVPDEKTWGLRSYLSEASQPQPGLDVYDVHSRSDRKALNGTALSQW
jgi:general secretion pathway protein G